MASRLAVPIEEAVVAQVVAMVGEEEVASALAALVEEAVVAQLAARVGEATAFV